MGNSVLLTINSGSSSCKAALFTVSATFDVIDKITDAVFDLSSDPNSFFDWLHSLSSSYDIVAIGHRFVHGGNIYDAPVLITDDIAEGLESLSTFDSLHAVPTNDIIKALRRQYPSTPQVVCFDTSFYNDLPQNGRLIAFPESIRNLGVRRYGFHGLSYTFVQREFERIAGPGAVNGRVIYCHLGSGSSLAATHSGKVIDTTMGFSPASGIPSSTRSGDIDPTIAAFLEKTSDLSPAELAELSQKESGLKALSGSSGDMKHLLDIESRDEKAAEAIAFYIYNVQKAIGALTATIGGIDSLIFTGGIGEQSSIIRARICGSLSYLGTSLDSTRNNTNEFTISADESNAGVHVIPTNETLIIAQQTAHVVASGKGQS